MASGISPEITQTIYSGDFTMIPRRLPDSLRLPERASFMDFLRILLGILSGFLCSTPAGIFLGIALRISRVISSGIAAYNLLEFFC